MRKIAIVSQPEYFRFCYEDELNSLGEVREFPYNFSMNSSQFQPLLDFDADYNFFFRGEFIPDDILQGLSGLKINFSSEPFPRYIDNKLDFTFDSFVRYVRFQSIRHKKIDYLFHYDESSLSFMSKDGLYLSGAFPFPVATATYAPLSLDKCWDIFFIGRSTAWRERFFGQLKHHYNFLHIAHGVWGPSLVDYANKSSICLNVHAESEVSWEPRIQMLLATGAFIISQKITPNQFLRPGIDFIEIATPRELYDAVGYYLAHPNEMNEIAAHGRQSVLDNLASVTVFSELLNRINHNNIPCFRSERSGLQGNIISSIVYAMDKFMIIYNKIRSGVSVFR